ncbi:hypothetical protein CDD81_5329 [Ophiocordyceps australis]|uniref:Uncharacterized protein n=1 Tax=Ophiocordyceps australis TaxID=1399860 RepID=A0A2C5YAH8_9HYPO|nr:hypothetical protein CDD81_5329 [Ophiocordyceps australis]
MPAMEESKMLVDYPDDESAVMDSEASPRQAGAEHYGCYGLGLGRSPLTTKTRSLSDGCSAPSKLAPAALIVAARTSKDDSSLADAHAPVTPRRADAIESLRSAVWSTTSSNGRPLSLQMPPRQFTPPPAASNPYARPPPLSPKLDHSHIYASPTNILPRRSRGLDFSRAATSLHHSTLAEQPSPGSSPTAADRAMNIPAHCSHQHAGPEQTSSSLWSMMGSHDRFTAMSTSLGSTHGHGSDSTSSDSSDDLMDEDMDEPYVTTPLAKTPAVSSASQFGPLSSPAMSSLASFQQRQRSRKRPKKRPRAPLGLGFNPSASSLSRSPPVASTQARRESISWQANQLHISGLDADEAKSQSDADGTDNPRGVIRRTVTRRGNLLPKTKTFARIRAVLAEEGAPADAETRREAEVVRQVRESDMDLEPRFPPPPLSLRQGLDFGAAVSALSSPNLTNHESADDNAEDEVMSGDLSASSKQRLTTIKKARVKTPWDTFSESSSMGGARTTPPPPAFLPRGSSSGISEDVAMDSPALTGPIAGPSAAEITRRIHKRRRDDDLDPMSFKRRAVSPGMSVHNSPVLQSPMQSATWGSRPGSTGADRGGSSAQSESGSMGGGTGTPNNAALGAGGRPSKGRVGFQGMVDTNDGIMRMSIE